MQVWIFEEKNKCVFSKKFEPISFSVPERWYIKSVSKKSTQDGKTQNQKEDGQKPSTC